MHCLQKVDELTNPDVQFYVLSILKYLCLHAETLSNARREHRYYPEITVENKMFRGFLVWAQENLLIPKLWNLLRSGKPFSISMLFISCSSFRLCPSRPASGAAYSTLCDPTERRGSLLEDRQRPFHL